MNEENRKQFLILGALVLVLGFVLWYYVFRGDSSTDAAGLNSSAQSADAARGATRATDAGSGSVFLEADFNLEELIQSVKEVEFDYSDARQARNPMLPLTGASSLRARRTAAAAADATAENLLYEAYRKQVTGILWGSDKPLAVIDNEVVGVGHLFEGDIVVKEIGPQHVVLALSTEEGEHEVVRELKEQ